MRLQTKLAQRFFREAVAEHNLDADHAHLLAQSIDNGTMKIGQARLTAQLTSDWKESAISDITTSDEVTQKSITQSREDRAVANAEAAMRQHLNIDVNGDRL